MDRLRGNAVVAQSGGPTAVINSSACGIVQEALRHDVIDAIYGANNGILGIVREDLFDLRAESADTLEQLRCTPSAAVGSCRYRLADLATDRARYERLLAVFRAHDVRYFFFIGGNESMAIAQRVHRLAAEEEYELRVIGGPKTVHNDLAGTDHCPGYGSVAKYLATSIMEAGRDTEAMYAFEPVTIAEVLGQASGWVAAAAGLARRREGDAPHLIYVPEIPFSLDRFLDDVREVHRRLGRCFVVVSEGILDGPGEHTGEAAAVGTFGPRQLGGVASYLRQVVAREIGIPCRYNRLDTCQRNAVHFASRTDSDEAYLCGREAVRQAVAGQRGVMVTLVRESDRPYRCTTGLARLEDLADGVRQLPRHFMDVAGTNVTEALRTYAGPLVLGEVPLRMGTDGLPEFARLQRRPVPRKLPVFPGKTP
ncbi:MAG: 6-phosphofructokinase [Gemmataceae bacterium]|nr:6-phosphofructokinase [Gemmataceae bacterium]